MEQLLPTWHTKKKKNTNVLNREPNDFCHSNILSQNFWKTKCNYARCNHYSWVAIKQLVFSFLDCLEQPKVWQWGERSSLHLLERVIMYSFHCQCRGPTRRGITKTSQMGDPDRTAPLGPIWFSNLLFQWFHGFNHIVRLW